MNILDVIFPRWCMGCGRRLVSGERYLCLHCMAEMPRTFLWQHPEDNKLAQVYYEFPMVKNVAAYTRYNKDYGLANTLVKAFKYKGHREIAKYCGKLMAEEIGIMQFFFEDIDAVIPVPLTFRRRMWRGYNQSEYLAKGITNVIRKPVCTSLLKRKTFAGSQTNKTIWERIGNVQGAFCIDTAKSEQFKGKHILLVDDVITVGATTKECCKALSSIPNITISILSFATARHF